MAKREFTTKQVQRILKRHSEGYAIYSIAESFHCGSSVISRVLEESRSLAAGVRYPVKHKTLIKLKRRYENEELTGVDVADIIGCSLPTAMQKLRLVGTSIRPRGRPCLEA